MFCEVERSYIEDGFNLYGLRTAVPNFSDCLDLILDRHGHDDSDDSHLTQSACTLYGLIHARYIITAHGLDAMYNKYAAKEFGTCPLVQCHGQPVLPVGLKDEIGCDSVKIFCPKCQCVYHPPAQLMGSALLGQRGSSSGTHGRAAITHSGVDGASFGTTFPHLFLMTFNNLVPDGLEPNSSYIPRVFGFKVYSLTRGRGLTNNNVRSSNNHRSRSSVLNDDGNGHVVEAQWRNDQESENGIAENGDNDMLKSPANDVASGNGNMNDVENMKVRQQDEVSSISTGSKAGKRKRRGR